MNVTTPSAMTGCNVGFIMCEQQEYNIMYFL